uniref:Serine aminopeptidase S33 domain-containing protein n=1 Tax=Timema douglasi TaxID=61478 RepID=A0A7R8W1A7_TIMDO|nr:unnamed protein product [Timema douglasi]
MFDLSAMIDYVLSTTGESSLYFVGHSMGATIAVVLLSERPEYNEKLKITILLAPVVRLRHNTSIFRHSSPLWKALQKVTSYSGMFDFPPDPPSLHKRLGPMCKERYIGQGICANILHTVAGYAGNINNVSSALTYLRHLPRQVTRPLQQLYRHQVTQKLHQTLALQASSYPSIETDSSFTGIKLPSNCIRL